MDQTIGSGSSRVGVRVPIGDPQCFFVIGGVGVTVERPIALAAKAQSRRIVLNGGGVCVFKEQGSEGVVEDTLDDDFSGIILQRNDIVLGVGE